MSDLTGLQIDNTVYTVNDQLARTMMAPKYDNTNYYAAQMNSVVEHNGRLQQAVDMSDEEAFSSSKWAQIDEPLKKIYQMLNVTFFDVSTPINEGDIVLYAGQLYKATTSHEGTWNSSHFAEAYISDLTFEHNYYNYPEWQGGGGMPGSNYGWGIQSNVLTLFQDINLLNAYKPDRCFKIHIKASDHSHIELDLSLIYKIVKMTNSTNILRGLSIPIVNRSAGGRNSYAEIEVTDASFQQINITVYRVNETVSSGNVNFNAQIDQQIFNGTPTVWCELAAK